LATDFLAVALGVGILSAFAFICFKSLKKFILMKTKTIQEPEELSYFGISLKSFLKDSHPLRVNDAAFIAARADSAAQAYSHAVKSGLSHDGAEEIASAILYEGLHFSPCTTLVNIIWDEFAQDIPQEDAREAALLLLPLCRNVLERYTLSDDFAGSPEHDLLYTELTGLIQILLEDGI
jgi:hypothetical protein